MSLWKRIVFVGMMALVVAAVTVAAAELLVRLLVPSGSIALWLVRDPVYGYIQRPGVRQVWHYAATDVTWRVRINSLGMRGPECDLQRRDLRRVLLLGDSFTFGYGLDEDLTFAGQLRRMLNQDGQEWCVLNAGVGGWGTIQEVKYGIRNLEKLRPDVIILTFCPNDPVDDIVFLQGAAGGLLPYFPGKRFLRNHSHLYGLVYSCVHSMLFHRVIVRDMRGSKEPKKKTSISNEALLERRWKRTLWYLRLLRDRFLQFNPHGLFIIQATHPWHAAVRNRLMSLADGEHTIYVDLEEDARRIGLQRIFLSYDPHWTAEMHAAVARRLFEVIRSRYPVGQVTETDRRGGVVP